MHGDRTVQKAKVTTCRNSVPKTLFSTLVQLRTSNMSPCVRLIPILMRSLVRVTYILLALISLTMAEEG